MSNRNMNINHNTRIKLGAIQRSFDAAVEMIRECKNQLNEIVGEGSVVFDIEAGGLDHPHMVIAKAIPALRGRDYYEAINNNRFPSNIEDTVKIRKLKEEKGLLEIANNQLKDRLHRAEQEKVKWQAELAAAQEWKNRLLQETQDLGLPLPNDRQNTLAQVKNILAYHRTSARKKALEKFEDQGGVDSVLAKARMWNFATNNIGVTGSKPYMLGGRQRGVDFEFNLTVKKAPEHVTFGGHDLYHVIKYAMDSKAAIDEAAAGNPDDF